VIFRLRDYILSPAAIYREHAWLGQAQWWSPERRRAWVQERLERTLDHAVRNVPFYRRTLGPHRSRFAEMIDRLDLSGLPMLTKEDVRQHYDDLRADDFARFHVGTTETSGSTGTPTRFMLDRESNVHQFAAIWRVLNWAGYGFGQPYADMTGYLPRGDGLAAYDWRTHCLHLSSFNFKKEHIPEYVRRLRAFRPVFIKAYPSAIDLFCRWLRELGIDDYRPRAVLTCAESLLDHQREAIADVLQCPIYDFYGQNERGALISTCGRGTYHVHEEYALTELVPAGDGETAHIVATNFHNRAMPLIRYRTDDLAAPGDGAPCTCGRSYATVGRIIGRIEDIVVTPDGRHVGRLDAAFKYSPGIRLGQVVQERLEEIEVRIVRAATFGQGDLDRLEHELRARLGTALGIRYVYVEDIPPGPNGKVKFMVSRLGHPSAPGVQDSCSG
jgi:phenylacetate-CoA ligase